MGTVLPKNDDERVNKGPRVVVRISEDLQFLLTTMARHLRCNKKQLHDDIWAAGLKAHLGVCEEDLDELAVRTLPRGVQPPRDPKRLAQALTSDR
jgi:hypothetical protein